MENLQDKKYLQRSYFSAKSQSIALALVGVGVIGLALGCWLTSPDRVWASYLLNTFFFFSISLGGLAFAAMQDTVDAKWGRGIKRFHEALGAFLPVSCGLLAFFLVCIALDLFGVRDLYLWMRDPEFLHHFPGKDKWLQVNWFVIRNLIALGVIAGLGFWQLRTVVKRDQMFLEGKDEGLESSEKIRQKLKTFSPPILVAYALSYTVLTLDLLMSLAPAWFSTLWTGWLFAIMMQTLMATILFLLFHFEETDLRHFFGKAQKHDIGKLMHGFTIFFAYLTFAHVLTYWYGNIPEFTEYFIARMNGDWFYFITILPFILFVIPLYTLLIKRFKWTKQVILTIAGSILVGQWFVYVLIVIPTLDHHHWPSFYMDLFGLAFALGLLTLTYLRFAKTYPMIAAGDILLHESLKDHH